MSALFFALWDSAEEKDILLRAYGANYSFDYIDDCRNERRKHFEGFTGVSSSKSTGRGGKGCRKGGVRCCVSKQSVLDETRRGAYLYQEPRITKQITNTPSNLETIHGHAGDEMTGIWSKLLCRVI